MMPLAPCDDAVSQRLAAELARVEARFSAELLSDLACVNDLVAHVERYRGKMLRPTLVLVTALAVDPDRGPGDEHRTVATVAEMVHMATLVHDDVLDDAEVRRRGATLNHLAGNEAAVMLGDYLISHAYHLCSSIPDPAVSRAVVRATNTVCEGELLQLANRGNGTLDERTYFEIIRRKTASLCGVCCRLSAELSGQPEATRRAVERYGEKLGTAFQIIDDVLDLTGQEQTVGKSLGRDLAKGKLTLPLIRYLAEADPAARREALSLLPDPAGGEPDGADPARAAALAVLHDRVTAGPAVGEARQRAERLVADAKALVAEHLPETPARGLMLAMADAVLSRRY